MRSVYCLEDIETGRIRFTEEGLRELGPYFARAGIDIRAIITLKSYLTARRAAAPYLIEHLRGIAAHGRMTPARQALLAVVDGRYERVRDLLKDADHGSGEGT